MQILLWPMAAPYDPFLHNTQEPGQLLLLQRQQEENLYSEHPSEYLHGRAIHSHNTLAPALDRFLETQRAALQFLLQNQEQQLYRAALGRLKGYHIQSPLEAGGFIHSGTSWAAEVDNYLTATSRPCSRATLLVQREQLIGDLTPSLGQLPLSSSGRCHCRLCSFPDFVSGPMTVKTLSNMTHGAYSSCMPAISETQVQEDTDNGGEDAFGEYFKDYIHDSPQNMNYQILPPTPALSQTSEGQNEIFTRSDLDVNRDSAVFPYEVADSTASSGAVIGSSPAGFQDPLFPTVWVIPPVLEPGQEMLLDELPTENTTNGASQITETADDVLSASQDSFWPSSPAQSLASTATATAGQLASPASFDSFSTSFTTSEYEFDGGDGAEELHADLFYASTALATSHNSGDVDFFPNQMLCFSPSVAFSMPYSSLQTPAYRASSPAPAENYFAAEKDFVQTPLTFGLSAESSSSPSLDDYSELLPDYTQAMQLSLSAQSAASASSSLSFSAQHPLFAPSMLPRAFFSDPPRLETEDSGSFIDPRRVLHGKRTREDVEDEQDEEFSRPGSKYRRMSISTINIDHAYADQIQPHDAATAGEERSKPEESFDIGDYLHLPMIHATAEDVGVTLLDGQDSEPSILPTQHLPNASWKNFLNPVVPDEPVQYSASPHPHDGQHFKAEQQPLTPDFRGLEQGVYSDHDRTTVSPRNLHIQDVQDVSVYKAEPLFYNSQDEPHALSMHKSHDGEQNLKHEFQEDSFGSPYGYTSSESYYSVGETDHPQSHHEPYHYPQPPQTNQQLQAARVQSAGSDTSSRVLLPMAATPHASFSAPMSCMEINAAQTDFGPRNFAMSSPRNSPSGSSAHHQEHHEYHGIVGTNTVSRRQPSSRSSSKSDAERANKDRMLLNLRSQGYTYQEIRRRCRFTEAESTLRGRYRLLTKRKEERVRKPQWTAYDDELLLSIVNSLAGDRQVGRDFRVAWKTVADSIVEGGGSYHFGNTTCRKRYDELMERQAVIKEEQSE